MFILKIIDNLISSWSFSFVSSKNRILVVPTKLLLIFSVLSRPDLIGHSLSPPPKRAFFLSCLFASETIKL